MKYLKMFNESVSLLKDELRKLSEDYLAYIIDKGLEIIITDGTGIGDNIYMNTGVTPGYIAIAIRINRNRNKLFTWDEIKYDILPFIEVLNNKYKIGDIYLTKRNGFILSLLETGFRREYSNPLLNEIEIAKVISRWEEKEIKEFLIEINNKQ